MLEIMSTYEGQNKNLVDIELEDGKILYDVPFFDKDGEEISYDEALELYGFGGLEQNIWDNEDYIKHIENYIK